MNTKTHDLVSYEEHARVKAQLARVEAVLADLLHERSESVISPALQKEMLAWLRNAETLHTFLQNSFLEYNDYGDPNACMFCSGLDGAHRLGSDALHPTCELLVLWEKVDPDRYQKTINAMFERWCEQEARLEHLALNRAAVDRHRTRGHLNRNGIDTQGRFLGIDWGRAEGDATAVITAHTREDGALVIDTETVIK